MKWVLLSLLILSGCSTFKENKDLKTGCDLTCKDCAEIHLKCNQDWDTDRHTETEGTMAGPTIGN